MQKLYLFILLICFSNLTIAQTSTEKELLTIENSDDAENFINKRTSKKNKIIVFNEEKHKTKLAKELFNKSVGSVKVKKNETEKIFYKVLKKTVHPHIRFSYIYFDSNKMSVAAINKLKNKIKTDYKNNIPFSRLAQYHSMDINSSKGGDTGWIKSGEKPFDFIDESVLSKHQINTTFTINTPNTNSSYFILKTHDTKNISEISVLKIVEPIE